MAIPHVKPFSGTLPRKAFDANDPRALDLAKPWDEGAAPEYALVGVPFDGAVLGRKGTADGPAAIREAFRYSSTYNFEEEIDLYGMSVADVGDVQVAGDNVQKVQAQLTETFAALWKAGAQPLVLGGDNSITFAAVRALTQSVAGKVGIIDFDAHLDVRTPNPAPSSGSPYYQIVEELAGRVLPQNIAQVGLRRFANSRIYREWANRKGIKQFTMKEVRRTGFAGILEDALAAATDGVDALYVSLDMDVVDQAWAPGVSAPSPDGLTPREVFDGVLGAANRAQAKGFEVVETAPNLDQSGNTARVAALSVLHYLVGRRKPAWTQPPKKEPREPRPREERPPAAPRGPPRGDRGGFGRPPPRDRGGFGGPSRRPEPRRW